ncbi:hypothetical protein QZH41_012845 [Actinostola sp. cb2023]|nr:hypothetical protein QZH41_012845 [Actinostola sp. cb2023]
MKKTFGENRHNKKVIDAASGTGILGRTLKDHGYTDVDALDICPGMLNESREKGIYKNLICAAICDQRIDEIETGSYDGLTCGASFTVGHIKPHGFNEILRFVKPGGVICFSMRVDVYDGQGFGYKEKMDELSTAGMWEFKEKTETLYYPNAAVKQWHTCYIFLYKRL